MAKTTRSLPRWEDLAPLVGLDRPTIRRSDRIAAAATIPDLRRIAGHRAPKAVFDYVDGAAESERSLARARRGFADVEFRPRVLQGVTDVDTSATILDRPATMPLVCAPTGFTRMMHTEGEPAVARASGNAGIPYALSTVGTTDPETLSTVVTPDTRLWFQLYVWRDRDAAGSLVERARAAGFEALIFTVDTPVAGQRLRDVRNGLTVPPKLTPSTLLDMAMHPSWWLDLLTSEPLTFASLSNFDGTVAELVNAMFDPAITYADLDWLREVWDGPLIIKGIQDVADAHECVERGADAIVVSNHGGRQLDRAPTPLHLLPEIAAAVGDDVEVYLDTGIMHGADIVAAVANGADACMIGRAYLYGLMAGGETGVDRALAILQDEMFRTMQLLGVETLGQLTPEHAALRA